VKTHGQAQAQFSAVETVTYTADMMILMTDTYVVYLATSVLQLVVCENYIEGIAPQGHDADTTGLLTQCQKRSHTADMI
jgi:hypothetical protein